MGVAKQPQRVTVVELQDCDDRIDSMGRGFALGRRKVANLKIALKLEGDP